MIDVVGVELASGVFRSGPKRISAGDHLRMWRTQHYTLWSNLSFGCVRY